METFLFLPTGIILNKLEDSSGKKGINAPSAVIEKKHSSGNDKKGFVFVAMCTCGNFFVPCAHVETFLILPTGIIVY